MNERIFNLRMQNTAYRQLLRDRSEHMTQEQIDELLDLIWNIDRIIIKLEKLLK